MLRKAIYIAVALIVIVATAIFADYVRFIDSPAIASDTELEYEIRQGSSFRDIALELHAKEIISKPFYWKVLARFQQNAGRIKAGFYQLEGPMTPIQILNHFIDGKTAEFSLTIPEGWSFRQLLAALADHPRIENTLKDNADISATLSISDNNPEGWCHPDTYRFPKGTTDVDFLRRCYRIMKGHLENAWESRVENLPLKTPYEALILASIVEKETSIPNERAQVAAVFTSRLKKGMLLQTDPTVIYGLGDQYDGDIRFRDLKRDTPYNTYLHKGLPPTPIALPGKDALYAVTHPAETEALYFVAKGDGGHYFSTTYEEHRKAVVKYQMKGNAKRPKTHSDKL